MDKISDDKIITLAQKCLRLAQDYNPNNRLDMIKSVKFLHLREQWPDYAKAGRLQQGQERPMLVVNRLKQFRNQVTNEIRQNLVSPKCRPVGDGADKETAEAFNGIFNHICSSSDAKMAGIMAAEWQVDSGLGYLRVNSKYMHDDTDDQELEILPVCDPFKVWLDPIYTKLDGSDAKWAIIADDVDRTDAELQYPDVNFDSMGWGEVGDSWLSKDTVRVAEYFWLVKKSGKGKTGRKIEKTTCMWAKIGGNTVLDTTELPISYLPIIPVIGNMVIVDGKKHIEGLTANAEDSQRALNFWRSNAAEMIALAPKAPFIGPAGSFDGYPEWDSANVVSYSKLEYNPVVKNGTVMPKPERQQFAPPPSGANDAAERAIDDMKACLGIYDAALANNPNQQSGKAVLNLQRQASQGTFHFSDNGTLSWRHVARILIEWAPVIYDTQRVIRILGEDGTTTMAMVDPNAAKSDPDAEPSEGVKGIYNLGVGRYDVIADAGTNYATRRQEKAEALMSLTQSYPALMDKAGDLVVDSMDWPESDVIADRLKKFLPPGVAQDKDGKQPDVDPEQLKQQIQQAGQQMEEMAAKLHELQDKNDIERTKLHIEAFRAETDRLRAMPIKNDEGELLEEWKAEQDVKLRREELELKAIIAKQQFELSMIPMINGQQPPNQLDEEIEEMEADEAEQEQGEQPTQTYDQAIQPTVDIPNQQPEQPPAEQPQQ